MNQTPAVVISPELKKCFAGLGFAFMVDEPANLVGAETIWAGLLELLETDLDLPLVQLGCIRMQQGDLEAATSCFDHARRHNSRSWRTLAYLSGALRLAGHEAEADAYHERALSHLAATRES